MIVADLMTRNPASVQSGQTLATAAEFMWACDCGAVPVVQQETGKVIGIITDRDICMATWSRGLAPGSISVDEVMSRDVVSCGSQDTILRAETLMLAKQIRRIPVLDSDERLVGMLSLADIARATSESSGRRSDGQLSSDGLATTLAGICRSHLTPSVSVETRASL